MLADVGTPPTSVPSPDLFFCLETRDPYRPCLRQDTSRHGCRPELFEVCCVCQRRRRTVEEGLDGKGLEEWA
jgi:hypothetical protein